MGKYIAIDIGGTNIKYGLIDDTDTLLEAHEIPTEAHKGGPEILRKVKGIVARYLEQIPVAGVCSKLLRADFGCWDLYFLSWNGRSR